MPFWKSFRQGWAGSALLLRPSRIPRWISKIISALGSFKFLAIFWRIFWGILLTNFQKNFLIGVYFLLEYFDKFFEVLTKLLMIFLMNFLTNFLTNVDFFYYNILRNGEISHCVMACMVKLSAKSNDSFT